MTLIIYFKEPKNLLIHLQPLVHQNTSDYLENAMFRHVAGYSVTAALFFGFASTLLIMIQIVYSVHR